MNKGTMICLAGCFAAASACGAETSNLLANGGFEAGPPSAVVQSWTVYASDGESTSSTADDLVHNGQGALVLNANGAAGMFNGAVQTIDVVPGRRYEMEAFVHACGTNLLSGTAYGQLVIEWKAEDGAEVSRAWSDSWDHSMSLTAWRRVRLDNLVAPEGAVKAVCGVHLFDGAEASHGAVVVDDVSLTTLDDGSATYAAGHKPALE